MQNIELKIQEAGIESEVGIFESYTLLVSMLGLLEVGFIPASVFVYVLMTVAFAEMIKLQENRAKEDAIQIKTKYVDWYFYFAVQFFTITQIWCRDSFGKTWI